MDECPEYILTNLPKELLLEAKELANNFDEQKYFSILDELFDYFDEKITLEEAIEQIKMNTRRFAKRQMTWFKRDHFIRWVRREKDAVRLVRNFLRNYSLPQYTS